MSEGDKITALLAFAQAMNISSEQFTAAATRLKSDEPTVRSAVRAAIQSDPLLPRRYGAPLERLCDGVPGYVNAAGEVIEPRVGLGDRPISSLSRSELADLMGAVGRHSAARRVREAQERQRRLPSYDEDAYGRGAEQAFLLATRAVLRRSEVAVWLLGDPTQGLKARRGGASHAVHITREQFHQWLDIASTHGDDPELDRLVLLIIRHTAARREAIVNLTLDAIDVNRCAMRLATKLGKVLTLPVNGSLLEQAVELARRRGARSEDDRVFHGLRGTPITRRRFDYQVAQLKGEASWAASLFIGPHAIRRLTLTEIAMGSGTPAATAFAGHEWLSSGPLIYHYLAQPSSDAMREIAERQFGPLDAPMPTYVPPTSPFAVPYGLGPLGPATTDGRLPESPLQRPADRYPAGASGDGPPNTRERADLRVVQDQEKEEEGHDRPTAT